MSARGPMTHGLSLSQKLVFGFVGFILVFAVVNLLAAARVVDGRVRTELQTSELSFPRSLAGHLFPQIRDRDAVHITESLLDEMAMREDKLEYLRPRGPARRGARERHRTLGSRRRHGRRAGRRSVDGGPRVGREHSRQGHDLPLHHPSGG